MCAKKKRTGLFKSAGLLAAIVILLLAGWSSSALAEEPRGDDQRRSEPIVGFWQITWTDAVSGAVILNGWDTWHSDHTETQDDNSPILFGNVCQGAWISLGERSFGLTHPSFFFFTSPESQEGQQDTTMSQVIFERVTVANDRKTFTGTGIIKNVEGINPLDPTAPLIGTPEKINITGTRVTVDVSQLPQP
jgi:hypothetical protein